jgi:hypothetical protein
MAGGVVVFAVASAATLLAVGTASADDIGPLTVAPATGTDLTAPSVTTSAGCPTPSNAYSVRLTGPGQMNFLVTGRSTAGFSNTAPFTAVFGQTFKDAAALNTPPTTIQAGTYRATLNCVSGITGSTIVATFGADIVFSDATHYTAGTPVTATQTALAATPASPITAGTQTTLTASITPANATGTVQFMDGTTNLGAPVAVAGGAASTAVTLAQGSHSLTAVFTGSGSFGNSTSTAVPYQVNAPQGATTITALSANPSGTVNQGTNITFTASVSAASGTPTGTVTFSDRSTALGAPVALTAGTATLTTNALALGTHSITATYNPTDPTQFASSAGGPVSIVIVQPGSSTASETISTEVLAGALVISVQNQQVTLPSPQLASDASKLSTSGPINTVRVADTRAGNPGWTVSGQVTDFSNGSGGSINGGNLGWTPNVVAQLPVQNVTAGAAVQPANAIAPGATPGAGLGLAASRTLATAAAGGGTGTADLGAGLSLLVPTSTVAGVYTATLTLTAI